MMNSLCIKKKIWYRLCIVGLLLIFADNIFCQTIISGKVKNDKGEVLPQATVTLAEKKTGKIISFAITDVNGGFSITTNNTDSFFVLSIKKLNYEFITQQINNENGSFSFTLRPKITELKEVTVKNTAIRQKGDTLSYNVKTFADQKDRSIGDVIAKLPGIEVQSDGKILYQGKPIQKYYIDGMDLLEGKYNLANNNLPYDAVTSVQVLENHQPIRVLDSLVPSDRASLNIKLKKDVTVSGSVKVGVGASPLLWEVNASPMVFTKNIQFIGSYQSNNVGIDVNRELKTLTVENLMEQLENNTEQKTLTEIIALKTPPVSSRRYLDNNSHMVTGNILRKLKNQTELRFNLSYINDYVKQNGQNNTVYYLPSGNIDFNELVTNQFFSSELRTDFTVQRNTPKGYLKNSFKTSFEHGLNRGAIVNNAVNISQGATSRYTVFSNQLKCITALGKQLITLFSFAAYNEGPQDLSITPGQFVQVLNNNISFENLQQKIFQKNIQTNTYVELTKRIKKIVFMGKAGVKYQKQFTDGRLLKESQLIKNEFENNLNNQVLKVFITPAIAYKTNTVQFGLQLPISYYNLSIADKVLGQSQQKRVVVLDPALNASYEFNNYWQTSFGVGYNNSFQDYDRILYGYLLQNYRTLLRNNFPIAQNKALSFNNGIYYRHSLKSLFLNVTNRYSIVQRPYILEPIISPNGTQQIKANPISNKATNFSVRMDASKYASGIKTTFGLDMEYAVNIGNQILQGKLLTSTNQSYRPGIKANARISSYCTFDYKAKADFSRNRLEGRDAEQVQMFSQLLRLNIFPTKAQFLGITAEHYYNEFATSSRNVFYADLTWRYSLKKQRIDLEANLTNIFDQRAYINTSFTDFYFLSNSFSIRPRQLLASIKWLF
jgi:hypothetical protein